MSILDLIWHLAGFAAPAFFVALGVAFIASLLLRRFASARGLGAQIGINFLVGLAVLLAGLVLTGRDGKMLTYAALVVAVATCQLILGRRA